MESVHVLDLLLHLRRPPSSRFHHALHLAVLGSHAGCCTTRSRFERRSSRAEIRVEECAAREAGRICLQVRVEILYQLIFARVFVPSVCQHRALRGCLITSRVHLLLQSRFRRELQQRLLALFVEPRRHVACSLVIELWSRKSCDHIEHQSKHARQRMCEDIRFDASRYCGRCGKQRV